MVGLVNLRMIGAWSRFNSVMTSFQEVESANAARFMMPEQLFTGLIAYFIVQIEQKTVIF